MTGDMGNAPGMRSATASLVRRRKETPREEKNR